VDALPDFFVALFALMLLVAVAARNEQVFSGNYQLFTARRRRASFVTPIFELKGHTSNVETEVSTDLSKQTGPILIRPDQRVDRRGLRFRTRGEQVLGTRLGAAPGPKAAQGQPTSSPAFHGSLLFARRAGSGSHGDIGQLQHRHPARRAVDCWFGVDACCYC